MKPSQKYLHALKVAFPIALALVAFALLAGCAAVKDYNKTVSAREDGVTVDYDAQSKDASGKFYHRVEYRSFK